MLFRIENRQINPRFLRPLAAFTSHHGDECPVDASECIDHISADCPCCKPSWWFIDIGSLTVPFQRRWVQQEAFQDISIKETLICCSLPSFWQPNSHYLSTLQGFTYSVSIPFKTHLVPARYCRNAFHQQVLEFSYAYKEQFGVLFVSRNLYYQIYFTDNPFWFNPSELCHSLF